MTNLEKILDNDRYGVEANNIIEALFQAQLLVKRQLDQGCVPQQYQMLTTQHQAYIAAQTVIKNYVSNKVKENAYDVFL